MYFPRLMQLTLHLLFKFLLVVKIFLAVFTPQTCEIHKIL
nr:MAG TPA: hypothetical protein [Caudoviricetes sp.]